MMGRLPGRKRYRRLRFPQLSRFVKEAGTDIAMLTYSDTLVFPGEEFPYKLQKACLNQSPPLQIAGPRETSSFHGLRKPCGAFLYA